MLVLVVLILLVLAAPYVYQHFHKDSTINFNGFDAAVAQLSKAQKADSIMAVKSFSNEDHPAKTYISNKLKAGVTIELNTADSANTYPGKRHWWFVCHPYHSRYRNRIGGLFTTRNS